MAFAEHNSKQPRSHQWATTNENKLHTRNVIGVSETNKPNRKFLSAEGTEYGSLLNGLQIKEHLQSAESGRLSHAYF